MVLKRFAPVFAAAAVLVGLMLYSWHEFGSVTNGISYLAGRSLLVDPTSLDLGRRGESDVLEQHQIRLENHSNVDVVIVGVKGKCGCITVKREQLPLSIPMNSSAGIQAKITFEGKKGEFSESLLLITDKSNEPLVKAVLTANVR